MDLWRIRFKDGIRAADSRLVWASTKESAEFLGVQYCEPRGYRFVGADIETVGREGTPLEAPQTPVGLGKAQARPISDKLPPAALYAEGRR